jgi:hypothetical protein
VFLKRRRKDLPEKDAAPRRAEVPEGVPVPRHIGEVWHILQEIAREEDPRFGDMSIVEHFNSSAEGQRDVTRWLNIYERRVDPSHRFAFPPHHRRHRGFVLIPRNWPPGVRWEAFDESTWRKIPVPAATDEAGLIRAIDAFLDAGGTAAATQGQP